MKYSSDRRRFLRFIQKYKIGVCVVATTLLLALTVSAGGNVIYSGASGCGKRVALTFDDGPHPYKTEKILDLLAEYDVRATFFVVGQNAEAYPGIVLREVTDGHEIGNHTYHHKRLSKDGDGTEEIGDNSELIGRITGKRPRLFRPPEGVYCTSALEAAKEAGCDVVLWNVDTRDWALESTESIVANVKKNVKDGSIILFHDFTRKGANTLEALRVIVPYLIGEGYELVTVSELIK